jgi:predicted ATPase
MFSRVEAYHYRCLENIGVDIPQFAIVVGANGAGKTTFLDIPCLIGDCLRQRDITQAFTQRQANRPPRCSALKELVFCNKGTDFFFALEAVLPEEILRQYDKTNRNKIIRYELRLEVFNEKQIQVKNEYLFLFSDKNMPDRNGAHLTGESPNRDWRFIIKRELGKDTVFRPEVSKTGKTHSSKIEPALLALPRMQFEPRADFPSAVWFHDLLTLNYLFYQPDYRILQAPGQPGLGDALLPDASNLPSLAFEFQNQDEYLFSQWQEHVKTALPNIERIELKEREEDRYVYFRLLYRGGYEVTSSGLSEGTLKILALTILPYFNNLPAVVFIEEPENGVHPQAIESILQSLSSAYNSQVLVSSHSPIVMANSSLDNILCARLDKSGAASMLKGREHPRLVDWKGQIDLGALFAAGVLG